MDYNLLFKNGSLKFVLDFVKKIYHDGFGVMKGNIATDTAINIIAGFIVIFCLYKLVGGVWDTMKFILNCFTY